MIGSERMGGSGAAQVTPHTVVEGYLTSESSTATTVVKHCITVKAVGAEVQGASDGVKRQVPPKSCPFKPHRRCQRLPYTLLPGFS
jgi:hypothetical protein